MIFEENKLSRHFQQLLLPHLPPVCLFVSKTQPAGTNDEEDSVILIAFVIKLVVF